MSNTLNVCIFLVSDSDLDTLIKISRDYDIKKIAHIDISNEIINLTTYNKNQPYITRFYNAFLRCKNVENIENLKNMKNGTYHVFMDSNRDPEVLTKDHPIYNSEIVKFKQEYAPNATKLKISYSFTEYNDYM